MTELSFLRQRARRSAVRLATLATGAILCGAALMSALPAVASGEVKRHAVSVLGEPAYKADFKHFDWVNPDAPKGGTVRLWAEGSFDSLNSFSLQGVPAAELDSIYDQLMVSSADEINVMYGLIAAWASYPEDYSSVTFGLRPEARFNDGRPVTADDVVYSFDTMKKANDRYAQFYRDVTRAERIGPHEVKFHFARPGNSKLPSQVASLTILPKHFYEGRDLSKTSLEPQLGSGPYRIKDVDRGRSIVYERVRDWWAKDLPVAKGQFNFDETRIDYFRERTAAFEQFKGGGIDYWYENTAKAWATEYDFASIKRGFVKVERLDHRRPTPMQAFVLNLRRPQYQDIRVRKALNLAFNFEEMNEQLLYSTYLRTSSFFDNSDMKPTGAPTGAELALLQEAQKLAPEGVPAEALTTEFKQPVSGGSVAHRRNLAEATKLLQEAGYTAKGTRLVDAKGQQLKVEFLLSSPAFERHTQNYGRSLERLGIEVSRRVVDPAQYQSRLRTFDFDVIVHVYPQSPAPGNEQRLYWTSAMADREGNLNMGGIKNKAIDFLVEKVVFAKGLEELRPAVRALDRVLMANNYVVAQWYYPYDRLAYWDKFGRPEKMPSLSPAFDRVWWFDPVKAKDLAARRAAQ